MNLTQPIQFKPLFMERVWGGRHLETVFGKLLPPGVRIGESWELVDRVDAQSVVDGGVFDGQTLHQLWSEHRTGIFGERHQAGGERFPLLIKWLDARERLSVQVHPPEEVAAELGGEPKTEMWYVAAADDDAELFAGLVKGTDRAAFESALERGEVERLLHRLPSHVGDCLFIPSGRVHAIGGGNVILEVQQNSDTTYRVFDWNRKGLDGKPRELHIPASLRSIDFDDWEPTYQSGENAPEEPLVASPFFEVEHWELEAPRDAGLFGDFSVITVLTGAIRCGGREFFPGDCFLIPAKLVERLLIPLKPDTTLLKTTIPA
ncbi:MAG TPA: type I phosphomannose isomerase catalytic subunit [Chthoniobacteraceae bacterium]|nr:type I phosphomannose isomerase catalytic subunit [Chthoniobacteraceae bacterium]